MREGSAAEAALVCARLKAMGIPAEIHAVTATPPAAGLQDWARRMRYQLLWRVAMARSAVIVTGHHADDQAETVQMRLERGSGLAGVGGLNWLQSYDGALIIRPFLKLPAAELRRYGAHLPAVDDASNRDERFERARLRRDARGFADHGVTADRLQRLARAARSITGYLDACLHSVCHLDPQGWACFHPDELKGLPEAVRVHLLRNLAAAMNSAQHPPGVAAAERLSAWLDATDSGTTTLGGLEWQARGGKIWVFPEAERPPAARAVEAGHAVFDQRWVLNIPCRGELAPLGSLRFAALRKHHPHIQKAIQKAPARAYWRWPVFTPWQDSSATKLAQNVTSSDKNTAQWGGEGFIRLEDGAIIPHLSRTYLSVNGDHISSLCMYFHARDGFAAQAGLSERLNP
ncbi:MAG: tRNA lysidine(34) synthetase TilS [Alphaproteobacteria bacterium]|nr:tRNA lysidine(34) synthetase TilS [Alphaproteobacteria bacterium]